MQKNLNSLASNFPIGNKVTVLSWGGLGGLGASLCSLEDYCEQYKMNVENY